VWGKISVDATLLQEVEKGCGPKFGVLIFNPVKSD
jgi:hypothetical protein